MFYYLSGVKQQYLKTPDLPHLAPGEFEKSKKTAWESMEVYKTMNLRNLILFENNDLQV